MEQSLLLSLIAFAWITCVTPGPNNVMLTGSGARFGFWHSMQHIAGISGGLVCMLLLMALGVGALFQQWPVLQLLLKIGGSAYLLYLAWQIAQAGVPELNASSCQSGIKPWRFHQAVLFQFMNPKAWLMSLSAIGSFTLLGEQYWSSVIWVLAVFALVGLKTSSMWTLFGVKVGQWLKTPRAWHYWNRSMGTLTALCVALIWFE
jgi:Putative threonine efflux protein